MSGRGQVTPRHPATWRTVLGVVWTTEQRVEHRHGGVTRTVTERDYSTLLACGHDVTSSPMSARVVEGRARAHCWKCAMGTGWARAHEPTHFTPAELRIHDLHRLIARSGHRMSEEATAAVEQEIIRLATPREDPQESRHVLRRR